MGCQTHHSSVDYSKHMIIEITTYKLAARTPTIRNNQPNLETNMRHAQCQLKKKKKTCKLQHIPKVLSQY